MNLSLIGSRLVEASPVVGEKIQRLRAEAVFRLCLAPPLLALSIFLAAEVSPFSLALALLPGALTIQGLSLELDADLEVLDALRARIGSNELQKLTSAFSRYKDLCLALAAAISKGQWQPTPD